jgi:hypothetical protein
LLVVALVQILLLADLAAAALAGLVKIPQAQRVAMAAQASLLT